MKKLPKTIYRYSNLDEYFFHHLIRNEFWFSNPKDFNDPYECIIGENVSDHLGVCCFSARNDSILMWSHYAKSHKGICVGYDTKTLVDDQFGTPEINIRHREWFIDWVIYSDSLPQKPLPGDNYEWESYKLIKFKSSEWEYEKEIRMMGRKGLVSFKRNAIKEIIFGLRTSTAQITSVLALLFQLGYENIEIRQAIISNNSFKVDFKNIAVPRK